MKFSYSEENYLKTIYHLQTETGNVSTNDLAEALQTKPASVTDMMKKLDAKQLLHYKPYYGFNLSIEGKKVALDIIRRHRLWEAFLSDKLNFDWEEVHELAEELEHISSKKLINKLDAFLGYPQFDPHGDPIPDNKGKIKQSSKLPLDQLPIHTAAIVCRVANHSNELLELLKHKKIAIGTEVQVRKQFDFDGSLELKIKRSVIHISQQLAKNIYVAYEL